ncbi:MAG: D-cysteine desulfhydrase family protein [Ardenticatenaceae bacterium]|nr:D-cysteine desulfhydrase family protein [Ardenticatenaceae bacterium]
MTPNYPHALPLAHLPTPIERLPRLTELMKGPDLYVKRDDLTGLAGGGNKTRKLAYLLAEAQAQGCDHVITIGGPQSNHCRQTAAAAARCGLGCSLILKSHEKEINGNLLLNHLLGAHLYWVADETPAAVTERVTKQLLSMGHKPYLIPVGGSNVVGATAYVEAMEELMAQIEAQHLNIDVIVHASGSGGTQAGMLVGAHAFNFRGEILGISVSRPAEDLRTQIAALATATATHLGLETVALHDQVRVNDDYIEPGYGVLTDLEKEAIQLVAQKEGLLLDPVYTGRAMGGLIDLIRWGAFTRAQRILFWHTGGTPALHAYTQQLI